MPRYGGLLHDLVPTDPSIDAIAPPLAVMFTKFLGTRHVLVTAPLHQAT